MISPDAPVRARLKWFDGQKGFGFVVPENEKADAFLHITTLKRAQVGELGEGACLLCLVETNTRGALVREVVSVIDAGREPQPVGAVEVHAGDTAQITGTVKWYKENKGFGFVRADDGGRDIFLHGKLLRRYGMDTIAPRTPLVMTVRETPKGRELVDFEIMK
jgi:cold shock protein